MRNPGKMLMEKPLVSVAMVVCNVERFLAEAIESILNQTLRDFEFIIVDFGSVDGSKSVVSRYQAKDSRIKLHVMPHCGLAEARNASCFPAQGSYIAIMDADDFAFPDRLERQVAHLEKHPEIAVLGGQLETVDESGRRLFPRTYPTSDREIRDTLEGTSPFADSAVVMRRQAFCAVEGYRKAFRHNIDYDLWLRLLERYQGANLPSPVMYYRVHTSQTSVSSFRQQALEELVARAAANIRRRGGPDPLWQVDEITPHLAKELGITDADLERAVVAAHSGQISVMWRTSHAPVALRLFHELLELKPSQGIPRSAVADGRLAEATIHYREGRPLQALVSAGRALWSRPAVVGRAPMRMLRRLAARLKRKKL